MTTHWFSVTASAPIRSADWARTGEASAREAGRERSEPGPTSDEPDAERACERGN
jgi:hypothetical protein